jgi:PAS domain S-box-containing protein
VEKSVPVEALIDRLLGAVGVADATPLRLPLAPRSPAEQTAYITDSDVLAEHLERFREVFDQAAIGMATMTLTGTLVRVNSALAALLGRATDELLGHSYADFVGAERDEVVDGLEELQRKPVDLVQVEHGAPAITGDRRLLATMAPVRDSLGRALYLFLQVQDVTAERQALEELRMSEARFRLLVDTVEDYAIFMLTPEGRIASWNAGAQRTKGYTAEEIIGQHFSVFYPEEPRRVGHPEHELEVALREGRYAEEGWRIRKDGSRFWASVVITTVRDPDGRHLGFAKVTRDITARREADERLRQSEQRFRLLVDAVEDYALFMLTPDGVVASWNSGAQRINGYTADEVIGRHFRMFYPPEVAVSGHCEHELDVALHQGHYEEEGVRIRKDGTVFWASVGITPVFDASGEHLGYAKITRDTTERRRLEEEREQAVHALASANAELESLNQRLQRAAEDQAQFLAVTAHELRTPVGVLGGSAEMLAQHWDQLEESERAELLAGMSSSSLRLRRLLEDLLTASRLQNSALAMRNDQVLVAELVSDAVGTARRTHPDAELIVDVAPDLAVFGDRDRLAQALENLVGNGLRHGHPPVLVTASSVGDTVEIRVSDQGKGVAEGVRPRLFERFATGLSRGGTGLGLFIVRELARAHGGDAMYEPGTGADRAGAFVIRLPAARN